MANSQHFRSSGEQQGALEVKQLSFWEGVALIVGTTIGAGILSMAYASRKAGYMPLLFWLVLVGFISTLSMLYVAECTLRSSSNHQLSGLARCYLGKFGSWAIFCAVVVNTMGALTAYTSSSGQILSQLLGTSSTVGSLIFFVPALTILYLGLKALGRAEKAIAFCMTVMILTLVIASLLHVEPQIQRLLEGDWKYMIPIFNVVVFSFQAQFIVPELARGFHHRPQLLVPSIITGMALTFIILSLMPLSIILLTGLEGISEVATLSWGKALGLWAFYTANIFALCAMMTSYWGLAGSCLTNVFDKFNLGSERNWKTRSVVLLLIGCIPLIISLRGAVGFVNALYFSGVISGFLFALLPILLLRKARLKTHVTPVWHCSPWMFSPLLQISIIFAYGASVLYAIMSIFDWLPGGW